MSTKFASNIGWIKGNPSAAMSQSMVPHKNVEYQDMFSDNIRSAIERMLSDKGAGYNVESIADKGYTIESVLTFRVTTKRGIEKELCRVRVTFYPEGNCEAMAHDHYSVYQCKKHDRLNAVRTLFAKWLEHEGVEDTSRDDDPEQETRDWEVYMYDLYGKNWRDIMVAWCRSHPHFYEDYSENID